jgi:hypothetical protein
VLALLLVLTAQSVPSGDTEAGLKARCSQLISYFDRYGATRARSDGRRNHARLSAEIDCNKRLYAEGIGAMAMLLRDKAFTVPPPGPGEIDIDE